MELVSRWPEPGSTPWGIEVRLRDGETGAWISGRVEIRDTSGVRGAVVTREVGASGFELPAAFRRVSIRAAAPGYRPLETVLDLEDAEATSIQSLTLVLDRVAPTRFEELALSGDCVLTGTVIREEDGKALPEVWVEAEGMALKTDSEGRFVLSLRAEEAQPGRVPTTALEVRAPGRAPFVLGGIPKLAGTHRFQVALPPGPSPVELQDFHRQTSGQLQQTIPDDGSPEEGKEGLEMRQSEATVLAPPASIRVGFADSACQSTCCGTSANPCNHVCVFSLETYVSRGLNDEWIDSWNAHSLRAGAVAYRSYGAYHVDHPRSASYDLCSSACCQVNDPDTSSATSAAVGATAGVLLEQNGTAFRAEYSAENNSWDDPSDGLPCSNPDLSCGDGFVGSPVANWPCLADAVAAGHGCFGHGRGMSQWGTKRWGESPHFKTWKWMADHYYNASGSPSGLRSAFLASPIDLQALGTCGTVLAPGGRFALWAQGENLGSTSLGNLLFGASLKLGSTWFSDPPGDRGFSAPSGAFWVGRGFDLPPSAGSGTYDLVGAFWLDVDQDGSISAADLQLELLTVPASVLVSSTGALFAGCFESGDLSGWSAVSP